MEPKQRRPITQFPMKELWESSQDPRSIPSRTSPGEASQGRTGYNVTSGQESSRKRIRGLPKDLVLAEVSRSGKDLESTISVRKESPWETFRKISECDLGGSVMVAMTRVRPSRLFAIRTVEAGRADAVLRLFRDIGHTNLWSPQDCYLHKRSFFLLGEHLPVSVDHLIRCDAYPREIELAAILAQLLDGLTYITNAGFCYHPLAASEVLISSKGEIKIVALEDRLHRGRGQDEPYNQSLGIIMMELMQKYAKEESKVGIDDIRRWPLDSYATTFLSAITSNMAIADLRQHPLCTRLKWTPGELIGLVEFARSNAHFSSSYHTAFS